MKHSNWINVAAVLSVVALGACRDRSAEAAEAEQAARNNAPAAPASRSLSSGTRFAIASTVNISSRYGKPGDGFSAAAVADVQDGSGRVVIPAGSVVSGTIVEVQSASGPNKTGTLTLAVQSVNVRGRSYQIDASIDGLDTEQAARAVSGGDVAKAGAGAAAGAIIGQVIGKNPKGTIIGAVVGAAAGTGYAVATKDHDIRLPAGTHIIVTLRNRLTVAGS